jgi:hypothetical protein
VRNARRSAARRRPRRASGTTFYFCSKGCVAKFSAEPERYLRPPERESRPEQSRGASASSSAHESGAPGGSGNVPVQNLFLAFVYNIVGVPIAAGVLYPFAGLLISPIWASAAMTLISLSVIGNALRLRRTAL